MLARNPRSAGGLGRGAGGCGGLSPPHSSEPRQRFTRTNRALLTAAEREAGPWTAGSAFVNGAVAEGKERCQSPLGALAHPLAPCGRSPCDRRFLLRAAHSAPRPPRKLLPPPWLPSPAVGRGPPATHLMTPCPPGSPIQESFVSRGLLTGRCAPVLASAVSRAWRMGNAELRAR